MRMNENYALINIWAPLTSFFHKTDVCLISIALLCEICHFQKRVFDLLLPQTNWKKLLSIGFVIWAYCLCGQRRRKSPEIFMEQGPSVSSMRLILKIRSICDKQTVVINVCLQVLEETKFRIWLLTENYFSSGFRFSVNFCRHLWLWP